eukprot:4729224-Pleurochrysis_carterae.AAC.1
MPASCNDVKNNRTAGACTDYRRIWQGSARSVGECWTTGRKDCALESRREIRLFERARSSYFIRFGALQLKFDTNRCTCARAYKIDVNFTCNQSGLGARCSGGDGSNRSGESDGDDSSSKKPIWKDESLKIGRTGEQEQHTDREEAKSDNNLSGEEEAEAGVAGSSRVGAMRGGSAGVRTRLSKC